MVGGKDQQWDIDLAVMSDLSQENDGYRYFLLAIDILSRYVWAEPMKSKRGRDVISVMRRIFQTDRKPEKIRTDAGKEFLDKEVQQFFKGHSKVPFVTSNETKANYAERAIKTIKNKLYRRMTAKLTHEWVGFLPQAVASYNNSYHRGIKRKPIKVNANNEDEVWKEMYKTASDRDVSRHLIGTFAFKVGDDVRMSHLRRAFQRDYQERWARNTSLSRREMRSGIPTYKLKDW